MARQARAGIRSLGVALVAVLLAGGSSFGADSSPPAEVPRLPVRSWGRVTGWVIDAATRQPIEGATVRIEVAGRFPEPNSRDRRALATTDATGRFRARAPLGRIVTRLDWGRVLTLHPFSLLVGGPGALTKQTRTLHVVQLNLEVTCAGYQPFRGPVPIAEADADAFAVTLPDIWLAKEGASFVADHLRHEAILDWRVEPAVARPGERITVTLTARLPRDRGYRYEGFLTSSNPRLIASPQLLRLQRATAAGDPSHFRLTLRLPERPRDLACELGFVLVRDRRVSLTQPQRRALLQIATTDGERRAAERVAEAYRLALAGDRQGALRAYREAQEAAPDYALAFQLAGDLCLSVSDPAGAAAYYQRLVALRPDDYEVARPKYALALLQAGRTDEAEQALADADHRFRQRPGGVPALVHQIRARIAARRGDFDAADQHLAKAALAGPLPGRTPIPPEVSQEIHLRRMAAAVERHPDDPALRLAYARVLGGADRWEQAAEQIRHALRLDPAQPWAYVDLAEACLQLDRDAEALTCLEYVVQATPENLVARHALADAYRRLDRYEAARTLYAEIVARQPLNLRARHSLALMLYADGDLAGARRELAEVLRLSLAKGELEDEGLSLGFQAIYLGPKRRLVPGYATSEGRTAAVILAALETLAEQPEHALAWLNLGKALVDSDLPALARPALERALAADPTLLDARYHLARAYRQEDRLQEAQRELAAVIAANPLHPHARVALAEVLARQGDLAAAQAQLLAHIRNYPEEVDRLPSR